METLERIIADHPFFIGLAPEYIQLLVVARRTCVFDAGTYVFREGEEANEFFLIRNGLAALEIAAQQRKPLIIATLGAGEVLGWSWVLPPYHWKFNATVRAIAHVVRSVVQENPDTYTLSLETR